MQKPAKSLRGKQWLDRGVLPAEIRAAAREGKLAFQESVERRGGALVNAAWRVDGSELFEHSIILFERESGFLYNSRQRGLRSYYW